MPRPACWQSNRTRRKTVRHLSCPPTWLWIMCSTTDVSFSGGVALPHGGGPLVPVFCLTCPLVSFDSVYHEELNAPIRRNKEEPKARPLRVGDTEKPEPEREYSRGPWRQGGIGRGGAWALGPAHLGSTPFSGPWPFAFPFPSLALFTCKWGSS